MEVEKFSLQVPNVQFLTVFTSSFGFRPDTVSGTVNNHLRWNLEVVLLISLGSCVNSSQSASQFVFIKKTLFYS